MRMRLLMSGWILGGLKQTRADDWSVSQAADVGRREWKWVFILKRATRTRLRSCDTLWPCLVEVMLLVSSIVVQAVADHPPFV